MIGEVLLLLKCEIVLAASGQVIVDAVDVDRDRALAFFVRIETDVAEPEALFRVIVDDVIAVVVLILAERDLHLDPGAFELIVTDFREPLRLGALIVDGAQRNDELGNVEHGCRAEPQDGFVDDDPIAGNHVHAFTGDVVTAARILAGRQVWVQAVRGTVRIGVQIGRVKVDQADLHAFGRLAFAFFKLRRLAHGVENDRLGGENRIALVIDDERVAGDRDRPVTVEMRFLADDLFDRIVDVHVADCIAGLAFLRSAVDGVRDDRDVAGLQGGHAGWFR